MSSKSRRKNRRAKGPKPKPPSPKGQRSELPQPLPPQQLPPQPLPPTPPTPPTSQAKKLTPAERDNYIQGGLLILQLVIVLGTAIFSWWQIREHRLDQVAQNEQRSKDEIWRKQEARERKEQFDQQLKRQQEEHDEINAPHLAFTSRVSRFGILLSDGKYSPVNYGEMEQLLGSSGVNLLFPKSPPPKPTTDNQSDELHYPTLINYGKGPAIGVTVELAVLKINGQLVKQQSTAGYLKEFMPNGMAVPLDFLPECLSDVDSADTVHEVSGGLRILYKRITGNPIDRRHGFAIIRSPVDERLKEFGAKQNKDDRDFLFLFGESIDEADKLAQTIAERTRTMVDRKVVEQGIKQKIDEASKEAEKN